jgi:sugar phosphate isomerase/epimerase
MRSAITVCLVPEAKAGPFVFHGDLEFSCNRAAETGFDAIELFPGSADEIDSHLLRQVLHRNRLQLAAMGTGAGWVRHKLALTSPDPAVRHRALQFIGAIIDLAGGFGAPAILGSMQGRAEGEVSRDQALVWLAEALEQLAPRAAAHGVPFLLEPLNRYESNLLNTVAQALPFLASLRTRNVRLLCDLFHMNIEEPLVTDALLQAAPVLGHIHFADSNRHAIGRGHTNLDAIAAMLRQIGYDGYLSAEVLPLPDPMEAARQTITSFRRVTQP